MSVQSVCVCVGVVNYSEPQFIAFVNFINHLEAEKDFVCFNSPLYFFIS